MELFDNVCVCVMPVYIAFIRVDELIIALCWLTAGRAAPLPTQTPNKKQFVTPGVRVFDLLIHLVFIAFDYS